MYATATLRGLEPDQLDELAKAHEEQAAVLRAAASRRREELSIRASTKARMKSLDRLPAMVSKFESQGMTRADALACVALSTDAPAATIALRMRRAEKQAKADQKAARDRAVIDLAASGQSNTEIGRRFGLHRDTVARIIQRHFRRGQKAHGRQIVPRRLDQRISHSERPPND